MRILIQFLPVLIPLVVYIAYAAVVRRQTELNGGVAPAWTENTPTVVLLWAGVMFLTIGLVVWMIMDSNPTDSVYVPSRIVDGEIVPGEFIPNREAQ